MHSDMQFRHVFTFLKSLCFLQLIGPTSTAVQAAVMIFIIVGSIHELLILYHFTLSYIHYWITTTWVVANIC